MTSLGYKEDDIGGSLTEPKVKIFKILQVDAAQYNGDVEQWWQQFLEKLTTFGNRELTTKVKEGIIGLDIKHISLFEVQIMA